MPPIRRLIGTFLAAALFAGCGWLVLHASRTNDAALNASLSAKIDAADAKASYAAELADYVDRGNLPEDADNWHLSIFTADRRTNEQKQLLGWFDSDPQLARLKATTHFHVYSPKSKLYSRYSNLATNGEMAVVLQDASGAVVYKASGANAPKAPWPLFKGIKECILTHCPHLRPCPKPQPKPEPTPTPAPTPEPTPVPDVGPPEPPAVASQDETLLLLGLFGAAIVVGFVFNWKKSTPGIF